MQKVIIITLLLSAVSYTSIAHALDETSFLSKGAEVHLSIERFERTLLAKGSQSETEVRNQRLKITAYESPYAWLQGGFHFGYVKASHDSLALTANLAPVGEFFGFQLRNPRDYDKTINLHWSLAYTYNSVDDQQGDFTSDLTWHDYYGELGLALRTLGMQISIGGYYAGMEGEEQSSEKMNDSSTVRSSQQLKSTDNGGVYASIGIVTNDQGRIELLARSGAQQGGAIIFSKYF